VRENTFIFYSEKNKFSPEEVFEEEYEVEGPALLDWPNPVHQPTKKPGF
jgi:hypothetical protein